MFAKEKKNENIYQEVLMQCINLIKKMNDYEQEQIFLAFEIGKNVDLLLKEYSSDDSVLTKFAREISKQLGKFFEPSRFIQYQQLYLNFGIVESIRETTKIMNEIDINILLKIIPNSKNNQNKNLKNDISIFIKMLKKIEKISEKLNNLLYEKTPTDEEIEEINEIMQLIDKKLNQFKQKLKNSQICLYN